MSTRRSSFSRSWALLRGISVGALALTAGCASTAQGPFASNLTPEQYSDAADQQCAGVPSKEQQMGLLAYHDALANAQPLKEEYTVGKTKFFRDRGVQLAVRAQPGLTVPWLTRVALCHVALVRSGRIAAPESDPLAVAGATVGVEEAYTGFVVSVHVSNDAAASDALRRATYAIAAPAGPATAEHVLH